jgi:serpin B
MGAYAPFSMDIADFTGIIPQLYPFRIFISKVMHEAVVEINEQGTEATAATGIEIKPFSMPYYFKCDRPFMFFIHEKTNNCLLFVGKFLKP